jgi:putative Mn2+ efflux pump MntP
MKSIHSVIIVSLVWLFLGSIYYPKWNKPGSEAAISWDVSGYYQYLPAIFIYKDVKQQNFMGDINAKYLPSPAYDQTFGHHDSGNRVNKYAIGQSVMYAPFFFVAHVYAKLTGTYPADGFSKPYQIAIWLSGLLISILGLFLLRKILKQFFEDNIVAWTLLALGMATNWTEYAAISNGMNHTWLFTLLCALILFTIRFYKKTDWISALGIGFCVGLSTLTRPTEIICVLIPLLWGITSLRDRISFLILHWKKCIGAAILAGLIISIQMIYWKYVAGEWIVYSYGNQTFDWFHPQIWRGLMGVNVGWWLYSPIMLLAMFGWVKLYKKNRSIFWPVAITSLLALYITLSWGHWESGGGLGQRNLIQIYPLLAFPLSTVINWFDRKSFSRVLWIIILLSNIYYTGWWIHQAHKGGFFQPGQMTTFYFYGIVGRLHLDHDKFKLLDTDEYFNGKPQQLNVIVENDFEKDQDSTYCIVTSPGGGFATCLNAEHKYYGPITLPLNSNCTQWLRFEGDFIVQSREWDMWKYAQWIIQFHSGEKVTKTNYIRLQRLIPTDNASTHIFFDVRIPKESFDKCVMTIWNGDSQTTILMDNLKVSCFNK